MSTPVSPNKNVVMTIINEAFHPIAQGVGFCAIGIICSIVLPVFAIPFYLGGASLTITGLVMKISDHYHIEIIEKVKLKAMCFRAEYPKFQLVTLIIFLVITPLVPQLGCIVAVGIGVYTGLLIGVKHIVAVQEKTRAERRRETSNAAATKTGL